MWVSLGESVSEVMVPEQPPCAAAQAEGHSVTVTVQQGEKAQPGCKETKVKNSLGSKASMCSFQASGIITYILQPKSDLQMIYRVQPLIFKSLMFSWPVSALSTHQFFFPLFQSQPSIKSPGIACPEPGEGQSPPGTGRSHPATGKASARLLYVQITAKRDRPQRGSTKLEWKREGTQQG